MNAGRQITFVDVGLGKYLSDTPSTRFPVYTRGNAGEVNPYAYYPLSYSTAARHGEEAMRNAMVRSGLATRDELDEGDAMVAVGIFGGYAYLNLSLNRVIALRLPGSDLEEVDQGLLGNGDIAPAHISQPADINRLATLRGLRFVIRTISSPTVTHLDTDKREVALFAQSRGVATEATEATLIETIRDHNDFVIRLFETHLFTSIQAATAVAVLGALCEQFLGERDVAMQLLAGIGDVESAAPAAAMFRLGKLAASEPSINAEFDAGLDELEQRLRSSPTSQNFVAEFDAFLAEFASRGPNEWEVATHTWGTNPALPLALIDRMRAAADDHDPLVQRQRLAGEREALVANVRSDIGPARWALFGRVLRAATVFSQARERSKTTVVAAIHINRLAAREIGRRVAARSDVDADDLWFVTSDEFDEFVDDPNSFRETIAERRRVRDELAKRVPPFNFSGKIPSPDTWPLRADIVADPAGVGQVLAGIAGCAGKATGRARIVLNPAEPGDLGPGDVLIAPITDPSWTPLFVPVEAVVVDVGAQMSHAVIVSRELGIPCVVSVTDATSKIPDGAMVEVDGTTGVVKILSLPDD